MCRLALSLACFVAISVPPHARASDEPKGEAARLQGVWVVVSGEREGKKMGSTRIAGRQIVIEGDKFTDMVKDKEPALAKGTFTIDDARDPRWIDASFTFGELSGKSCKGIYEIDGDTLRVVTARQGDENRPDAFKTLPATGQMMFVYRRVK